MSSTGIAVPTYIDSDFQPGLQNGTFTCVGDLEQLVLNLNHGLEETGIPGLGLATAQPSAKGIESPSPR